MEKINQSKISKDLKVSHSAVSQWFSGNTTPKYDYLVALNEKYGIPFEAWKDIKSFTNESITSSETQSKCQKRKA